MRANGRLKRSIGVLGAICIVATVVYGVAGAASKPHSSSTPVRGGTLTYLSDIVPPSSFDPATSLGVPNAASASAYFEAVYGLLVYENFATGTVVPQMAQSLTATNPSNWVLKLRPNVKFTDGTPFNANAVKYNWTRIANMKSAPEQAQAATIASMTVVNPLTLDIKLKAPNSSFNFTVAESIPFIASPTALKSGINFVTHPVGAGPFVLHTFNTINFTAAFARNKKYWDAPEPYLNNLVIETISSPTSIYDGFQTGAGQIASISGTTVSQAQQAGDKILSITAPGGGTFPAFNTTEAPFNSVIAREAFEYGFDPASYNTDVNGGTGTPVDSIFAKSSPYYVASATEPQYNPTEAQTLFNEYATQNGGPMTINVLSFNTATSNWITAEYAQFTNVTINIEAISPTDLLTALEQGGFDVAIIGNNVLTPAPLFDQFYETGASLNFGKFSDPAVDKLLVAANSTINVKDQIADYAQASKLLVNTDYEAYMITRTPTTFAIAKTVHGVEYARDGIFIWAGMWLS